MDLSRPGAVDLSLDCGLGRSHLKAVVDRRWHLGLARNQLKLGAAATLLRIYRGPHIPRMWEAAVAALSSTAIRICRMLPSILATAGTIVVISTAPIVGRRSIVR